MHEARLRRVFFALWPDGEAASHLAALGNELAGSNSLILPPASLHLTLVFVGAVTPDRLSLLEEVAEKMHAQAFDLSIDRLGFWPQRGILWAGCRKPAASLRNLVDALVDALRNSGFAMNHGLPPVRVPHLTLARRARCPSVPRLESPIRWPVREFALVESHLQPTGASYRTLRLFALDLPDAG